MKTKFGAALRGSVFLLVALGSFQALDYTLADRARQVLDTFEARAAAGACTPQAPCEIGNLEGDVCSAVTGSLWLPLGWFTARTLRTLPGELTLVGRRSCGKSSHHVLRYVAPSTPGPPQGSTPH